MIAHRPLFGSLLPVLLLGSPSPAQPLLPEAAHTNLYFPHLADGGASAQLWQTKLSLYNPNHSTATVTIDFYADDGSPLDLNFGSGSGPQHGLTIPPFGSRVLRSVASSASIRTGWAFGRANVPLQGNVTFRALRNGVPIVEISANATLPTTQYTSIATRDSGVAIANRRPDAPITVSVALQGPDGNVLGERELTVPPLGHLSFNVSQRFPNLPGGFNGALRITGRPPDSFIAWTVDAEDGVLSSLPEGRAGLPISHWDRIWLVYLKILEQAKLGNPDLNFSDVQLIIPSDRLVAASASSNGVVKISLALSELVGDSPGELAFAAAHQLAHILQFKRRLNPADAELHADQVAVAWCVGAGYDPYAAAGLFGKLIMAMRRAGAVDPYFDNLADPQASFGGRMANLLDVITAVCAQPGVQQACSAHQQAYHPHLPGDLPLSVSEPR